MSRGADVVVLRWLGNRLACSKQSVMINGQASEWLDVTSGVPQGSVMGAVLLIHNDIDNGLLLGYVLSCEINLQSTLQLTN